MKTKFLQVLAAVAVMLFISAPAFAADAGGAGDAGYMAIGAGLAVAGAAAGAGIGQGRAAASAMEGAARNPQMADKIQTMMILALAFMEALGIYGLLIALKLAAFF